MRESGAASRIYLMLKFKYWGLLNSDDSYALPRLGLKLLCLHPLIGSALAQVFKDVMFGLKHAVIEKETFFGPLTQYGSRELIML